MKNKKTTSTNYTINYIDYIINQIHHKLFIKYSQNDYNYNVITTNNLIFNESSEIVAKFKDYLILLDETEFLKKFYPSDILFSRLQKITVFYEKNSKVFPNYLVLKESRYLYKNIRKKQNMIDALNEIKKQDKENKKKTKGIEIFSKKIKNSINKCKPSFDLENNDENSISISISNNAQNNVNIFNENEESVSMISLINAIDFIDLIPNKSNQKNFNKKDELSSNVRSIEVTRNKSKKLSKKKNFKNQFNNFFNSIKSHSNFHVKNKPNSKSKSNYNSTNKLNSQNIYNNFNNIIIPQQNTIININNNFYQSESNFNSLPKTNVITEIQKVSEIKSTIDEKAFVPKTSRESKKVTTLFKREIKKDDKKNQLNNIGNIHNNSNKPILLKRDILDKNIPNTIVPFSVRNLIKSRDDLYTKKSNNQYSYRYKSKANTLKKEKNVFSDRLISKERQSMKNKISPNPLQNHISMKTELCNKLHSPFQACTPQALINIKTIYNRKNNVIVSKIDRKNSKQKMSNATIHKNLLEVKNNINEQKNKNKLLTNEDINKINKKCDINTKTNEKNKKSNEKKVMSKIKEAFSNKTESIQTKKILSQRKKENLSNIKYSKNKVNNIGNISPMISLNDKYKKFMKINSISCKLSKNINYTRSISSKKSISKVQRVKSKREYSYRELNNIKNNICRTNSTRSYSSYNYLNLSDKIDKERLIKVNRRINYGNKIHLSRSKNNSLSKSNNSSVNLSKNKINHNYYFFKK